MGAIVYLLVYALGGAILGGAAGACVAFVQCGYAIVSCDQETEMTDLYATIGLFALVGAAIGFVVGILKFTEEIEKEKEEDLKRQKEDEQNTINNWLKYYKDKFNHIIQIVASYEPDADFEGLYREIQSGNTSPELLKLTQIKDGYEKIKNEHIGMLHNIIRDVLSETSKAGSARLLYVLKAIKCLKIINPVEAEYADAALEKIRNTVSAIDQPTLSIKFSSYGEVSPEFLNGQHFTEIAHIADKTLFDFESINNAIKDGTCETVAKNYPENFITGVCDLMWYYAAKKPFEVDKFDRTLNLFERYTVRTFDENDDFNQKIEYKVCKVEEILAKVFSKKNVGGEGTAQQENEFISQWIEGSLILSKEGRYDVENNQELYALASGLAWMELYDMELNVLRKLVNAGVKLTEELQTRLNFLESGGKADVKIYTDVPKGIFAYDNSALEWGKKEFEVFFRKLANKKIVPEYSLAIERWTKTLPMVKGQKVSLEAMDNAFMDMVEDFDGEIVCSHVFGKAINLTNVNNENATLFTFTTERNRCVSMLFSFEKYGRNLNIEILTMFTPEKGLDADQLEKYCAAIKGNFYVNSFRETILQTIDEVIKVKEDMYGGTTDIESPMDSIY